MAKGEKTGAAKALYMAGYNYKEVARILRLSRNTVQRWAHEENWKDKRIEFSLMEENTITNLMEIFDFQVRCLKERKDKMIAEGNMKPFSAGDFDGLQKLFSTIKPDFQKFKVFVTVIKQFVEYTETQDLEIAKSILPIADKYLNEKHRLLS